MVGLCFSYSCMALKISSSNFDGKCNFLRFYFLKTKFFFQPILCLYYDHPPSYSLLVTSTTRICRHGHLVSILQCCCYSAP